MSANSATSQKPINGATLAAAERLAKAILRRMAVLKSQLDTIQPQDPRYEDLIRAYSLAEDEFLEIFYGVMVPSLTLPEKC